ncbi:MAG: prepilin-type N-terminal cleavage/methylation domain-containing protein [bacterium]
MLSALKKVLLKAGNPAFPEKGFTVVELMVALTILATAMLGMESIIFTISKNSTTARRITTATDLCQVKIEELKSLGYNAVVNCLESNINERGEPGGIFSRSVTVYTTLVPRTKMVLVRVRWTDLMGPRTVTLRTIVANI